MNKYFVLLSVLLTSCVDNHTFKSYPGKLGPLNQCHSLFDLGYNVDVSKCEKDTQHPKYKVGQKLKVKEYDSSCNAIVMSNWQWTTGGSQSAYSVKIYCNGNPVHDRWCDKGNFLNCPEIKESDLFVDKKK